MQTRIGKLRREKGLRQSDLAKEMGISTSAIGMYEQGRREPDMKTLLQFARLFNVSVDYLIGASDIPGQFDLDAVATEIAKDLMAQPALMFNAESYAPEELAEIQSIIESSVRLVIQEQTSR